MTEVPPTTPATADPQRWKALGVLLLVQFMLILDVTVVNVALPSIQHDLHFSRAGLAWVVDGYVLMAGSLLLLGGRLGDLFGRRRLFLAGVALFGLASVTSGVAQDPAMLVASRFAQGVGEALAAPAALGLIALLFTDQAERAKAIGFFGGVSGIAGTLGPIISGALVVYASWRWIFFLNIPVAIAALVGVPRLVQARQGVDAEVRRQGLDLPGAVLGTAGLSGVVFGFVRAADHPWGSVGVVAPLVSGIALLIAFAVVERSVAGALIPPGFFGERTRAGANITTLAFSTVFFSQFYFITLYLQQVRHYSALRSGLAYLPFGLVIGAALGMATALLPKVGARIMLTAGLVVQAVGVGLYSIITPGGGYLSHVVPGMVVLAFGSGLVLPTLQVAAVHRVTESNAGLASGVQQAVQQIGGAIGLAVLATIALRHAERIHAAPAVALTSGYVLAFQVGAAMLLVAAALAAALLPGGRPDGAEAVAPAVA